MHQSNELPVSVIAMAKRFHLHIEAGEILYSEDQGELLYATVCVDRWLTAKSDGIRMEVRLLQRETIADDFHPSGKSILSDPINEAQALQLVNHWGQLSQAAEILSQKSKSNERNRFEELGPHSRQPWEVDLDGKAKLGHPLIGRRVLDVNKQSADFPLSFRDVYKGLIVDVVEGANPLVVVKFDGLVARSYMNPNDLAFCELWPNEGCRVKIHGVTDSKNSDARETTRESLADEEFSQYQFGEGVTVVAHDNWDTNDKDDFTKIVYITFDDSDPEADSERVSFHVRFNADGTIDDAYGLSMRNGSDVGQRHQNELEHETARPVMRA